MSYIKIIWQCVWWPYILFDHINVYPTNLQLEFSDGIPHCDWHWSSRHKMRYLRWKMGHQMPRKGIMCRCSVILYYLNPTINNKFNALRKKQRLSDTFLNAVRVAMHLALAPHILNSEKSSPSLMMAGWISPFVWPIGLGWPKWENMRSPWDSDFPAASSPAKPDPRSLEADEWCFDPAVSAPNAFLWGVGGGFAFGPVAEPDGGFEASLAALCFSWSSLRSAFVMLFCGGRPGFASGFEFWSGIVIVYDFKGYNDHVRPSHLGGLKLTVRSRAYASMILVHQNARRYIQYSMLIEVAS